MAYRGPQIEWPRTVKHGTVKSTVVSPTETLLSLGRRSARGGVKHLGVLSDAEMLATYQELGRQLARKGLIQRSAAA